MPDLDDLRHIAQDSTDLPVTGRIEVQADEYVNEAVFWLNQYFEGQAEPQAVRLTIDYELVGYVTADEIVALWGIFGDKPDIPLPGTGQAAVSQHKFCCPECDFVLKVSGKIDPKKQYTCDVHTTVTLRPCPDVK